ncbi:MAG: gliding motility lipoprotein GldH [Chitinophagales bacterium]|nr:gliding motility lipoprotein GldH [Chitinophagales bacterium]MDW8427781.1 gliding motility lipoprotein GldH [Chitinophagales bacterium]
MVNKRKRTARLLTTLHPTYLKKRLLWFLIALLPQVSCEPNRHYEKNIVIKKYVWDSAFVPEFVVEISDTSHLYNLYLNIRHATHYPYRNIWLIVSMISPDGQQHSRRIEVQLGDEHGKWFGDGLGDIWDYQTLIQQHAYFPAPGLYRFQVIHNMRQDPLPGIMAIGLRIEKAGWKKTS